MDPFVFYHKTKVYFGVNEISKCKEILSPYKEKRMLVVGGRRSIQDSGLLSYVLNILKELNIYYIVSLGVEPNPKLEHVVQDIKMIELHKLDMILAIGGGSVIDSAKLTAVAAYTGNDPFDYNLHKIKANQSLPLAVILTLSATGSEMSDSCVITSGNVKKGFNSPYNQPELAILDPALTCSVGAYQTAAGSFDIIAHTLERYLSPVKNTMLTDEISFGLIRTVMTNAITSVENPNDLAARENLMWASTLSHNGMTGMGRGLILHQIEHAISGYYDFVSHGAGLALIYPTFFEITKDILKDKYVLLFKRIFDLSGTDEEIVEKGIQCFKDFIQRIGLPLNYHDLGIENPDIDGLVELETQGGSCIYHGIIDLTPEMIRKVLEGIPR